MRDILVHFEINESRLEDLNARFRHKARLYTSDDISTDFGETLSRIEILLTSNDTMANDPGILRNMPNLELIQSVTAGVDEFPFQGIRDDVTVCTASGALSESIAEHCFALILALAKNIVAHTNRMTEGIFKRDVQSKMLFNAVIGIIGFGSIGRQVAAISKAFGMRILAINRRGQSEFDTASIYTLADLDYVLSESDVVVISLPLTRLTEGLIGAEQLEMIRKEGLLVNVSRAGIIRQRDLYHHLQHNPEFSAASDVWWRYPRNHKSGESFQDYPFHMLDNFIMTPHVADNVSIAWKRMFEIATENIVQFLDGRAPKNIVKKTEYFPGTP